MSCITYQQALEQIDDYAADEPLDALRSGYAEYLTEHRLEACALAEPLAAMLYAGDRLTAERYAWCLAEVERDGSLKRYVPDQRAQERLMAMRDVLDVLQRQRPPAAIAADPEPEPEPMPVRTRSASRMASAWVIPCDICGTEFRSRRADARTCSARCRQKASRARRSASPDAEAGTGGTTVPAYL